MSSATIQCNNNGRSCLVTGGSKGIGLAIAKALYDDGFSVAIVGRDADSVNAASRTIGPGVLGMQCDITDRSDVARMKEQFLAEFNKLDVLVSNAGKNARGEFSTLKAADISGLIHANLTSHMLVTHEVLELLVSGGRVVNVSSVASIRHLDSCLVYGVAKAGLCAFTRSLAFELAERGITVNAVAPWYIETDLTRDFLASESRADRIRDVTPLKRLCDVSDVIAALRFLVSSESSYVTGQTLVLDGGVSGGIAY